MAKCIRSTSSTFNDGLAKTEGNERVIYYCRLGIKQASGDDDVSEEITATENTCERRAHGSPVWRLLSQATKDKIQEVRGDECRTVTVQTGGSVIIPCHYESKYTQHKKYWSYHPTGSYYFSSILTYANKTKGDVSVIDHPDQSLFTVTMRDLQHQNTGYYMCAVEIERVHYDVYEWCYLKIQSAPDVSVMSSSVTVDEGGNISVQCLYISTYKYEHKQWCRYKDKRCYTVGSGTSQYLVEISDDRRGCLTVVMSGLMKSYSGWYYCSVGDLQAPVQLTVKKPPKSPDLSVMSSSVTVDEGGNISVQCLYTSTYKNEHKQWCRYKDKRCYTSQNASVKISDDGRGSMTVVMSGLMKSESGWYYCSVGDLQAPVQLTVNVAEISVGNVTPVEFTDGEATSADLQLSLL
nr:polymeric immunoglobulin receptor-like [Misgurnus anguillicaudatus]